MSSETYKEHYEKYLSIYEDLATINGSKTVWIPTDAHDGWYVSSAIDDEETEAWKKGYPYESRPSVLPDDLSADVERTAFTTITYAPDEAYKKAYFKKSDNDNSNIEWLNNNSDRLPDYGDMSAWALFVDIDIKKEYKQRPLKNEYKNVLETRLKLWVKAFSKMAGGIEHVQLLDSGGGIYVFVPPSALAPIAYEYDKNDRNLIYREIGNRMRKITDKLNELVCDSDDKPDELFYADKVQNKNRQFKTIGSIHKSINAVVHPIDPEDISLEHKRIEDINSTDITEAKQWVNKFTDTSHEKCIDNIIEYLFQGQFTKRDNVDMDYVNGNTWINILNTWLDNKKSQIEKWEDQLDKQSNISEEELDTKITADKTVAQEAIRRVSNNKLKKYIVNFVGKDNVYEKSGNEMDFFPFWRAGTTQSGRSAFYDIYENQARFTDKSDGTSRGIVYWVALEMTYDDENYPNTNLIEHPKESLTGYEYRQAVLELIKRGENIPLYVREPTENSKMDKRYIASAGKILGIISDKDIIEFGSSELDGSGIHITPKKFNKTLQELDDYGIMHNYDTIDYIQAKDITNIPQDNYITKTSASFMPEFDSKSEFITALDEKPDSFILFNYYDSFKDKDEPGIMIGAVIKDNEDTITLGYYDINALEKLDNIRSEQQLIKENVELKKKHLGLFIEEKYLN